MASEYTRAMWRDHSRDFRRDNPERVREIALKSYEKNKERWNALRRERRAKLNAADTADKAEAPE